MLTIMCEQDKERKISIMLLGMESTFCSFTSSPFSYTHKDLNKPVLIKGKCGLQTLLTMFSDIVQDYSEV